MQGRQFAARKKDVRDKRDEKDLGDVRDGKDASVKGKV
jgi:hypothetical protein